MEKELLERCKWKECDLFGQTETFSFHKKLSRRWRSLCDMQVKRIGKNSLYNIPQFQLIFFHKICFSPSVFNIGSFLKQNDTYILKKNTNKQNNKKPSTQEIQDILWSKRTTKLFLQTCPVIETQKPDAPFNEYFSLFNLHVPY